VPALFGRNRSSRFGAQRSRGVHGPLPRPAVGLTGRGHAGAATHLRLAGTDGPAREYGLAWSRTRRTR
jgi:hypothetical protein